MDRKPDWLERRMFMVIFEYKFVLSFFSIEYLFKVGALTFFSVCPQVVKWTSSHNQLWSFSLAQHFHPNHPHPLKPECNCPSKSSCSGRGQTKYSPSQPGWVQSESGIAVNVGPSAYLKLTGERTLHADALEHICDATCGHWVFQAFQHHTASLAPNLCLSNVCPWNCTVDPEPPCVFLCGFSCSPLCLASKAQH